MPDKHPYPQLLVVEDDESSRMLLEFVLKRIIR